jgi:hypothetical protein
VYVLGDRSRGGGGLDIEARALSITDGAGVATTAFQGRGANIRVAADSILLNFGSISGGNSENSESVQGGGASGRISIDTRILVIDHGSVSGGFGTTGRSGNIVIRARESIEMIGSISSAADFEAAAGRVEIRAPRIEIVQGLVSSSTRGTGSAGQVLVVADNLGIRAGGRMTATTSGSGAGGKIAIRAGDLVVDGPGTIVNTESTGPGAAGAIDIRARNVSLVGGGQISSRSSGTGEGGRISIRADTFRSSDGVVTTQALTSDGGDIDFRVGHLFHLANSRITTAVGQGAGAGGNIAIDPIVVVLDRSEIRADASGGPGGNIAMVAGTVLQKASVISASSERSVSGNVTLTGETTLGVETVRLSDQFTGAAELLHTRCAARSPAQHASRFTTGTAGVAAEPGDWLGSLLAPDRGTGATDAAPSRPGAVGPRGGFGFGVEPGQEACAPATSPVR